jgi:OHCU decarboxylase
MNSVLERWNSLSDKDASAEVLSICGSTAWASSLAARRPCKDEAELARTADDIWWSLTCDDWLEAFRCHPRIGERKSEHASQQSTAWSQSEQSSVASATVTVTDSLAAMNREYEERFGFTYIVCATGKSAEEMLSILERRLSSDRAGELREAAEQQRQITQIRLRKWLVT